MKVNWFHLMPYRWLPDDFRERYRSVWVDIPSSLWDSRAVPGLSRHLRRHKAPLPLACLRLPCGRAR